MITTELILLGICAGLVGVMLLQNASRYFKLQAKEPELRDLLIRIVYKDNEPEKKRLMKRWIELFFS